MNIKGVRGIGQVVTVPELLMDEMGLQVKFLLLLRMSPFLYQQQ